MTLKIGLSIFIGVIAILIGVIDNGIPKIFRVKPYCKMLIFLKKLLFVTFGHLLILLSLCKLGIINDSILSESMVEYMDFVNDVLRILVVGYFIMIALDNDKKWCK